MKWKASILMCVLALSFTLFNGSTNNVVNAESSIDGVSKVYDEPHYFDIHAALSSISVSKSNNIELDTSISVVQDTDKFISVSYILNKLSDDKFSLVAVNKGDVLPNIKLSNKEIAKKTISLGDLSAGQYSLIIQANSKQSEDEVWGGEYQLLFTINDDGLQNDWLDKDIPSFAPSKSQGDAFKIAPYISHNNSKEYAYEESPTVESNNISTNSLSSVLTGHWDMYKKNSLKSIRNAKVELRYRDQFYIWRTMGTTYTDSSGNWSMSYSNPNANYWELIIYTQSSFTTVKDANSSNNTWSSNIFYSDMNNGGNVNLTLTNNTSVNKAFELYDDIVTLKNYLTIGGKDPGSANSVIFDAINNTNSSGQGNRHSSGTVYLYANSVNKSTVMHEMGHNYMYKLYSNSMPSSGCPSPHYFNQVSNVGCAWVEGWADFLPIIFSNGVYYYSGSGSINMENISSYVAGDGDDVEGRITATLWDLYDTGSTDSGNDTKTYSFSNIYRAMWDGKKNNLSEYWSKWNSLGYDANAVNIFNYNGIDY